MKTASLDTWTSLFLVVVALGLFLAALLFSNRSSRRSSWEIVLLLLGFSLVLIQYVFFWTGYQKVYPYVHFFDNAWYLLFGPLTYGYLRRWFVQGKRLGWYHYLPATIAFVLSVFYIFKTDAFTNYEEVGQEYAFYFFQSLRSPWIGVLSLFVYQFNIWDLIRSQDNSPTSQWLAVRRKWTRSLAWLYTIFTIAYVSYYLLVRLEFFNPYWDYGISFTMTFAIYTIGYFVFKEPAVFNGELLHKLFTGSSQPEELPETNSEQAAEKFQQLCDHIQTEKSYLNPDLRLSLLADEIQVPLHELSQLINQVGNTNFNTLINDYRLKAAVDLLVNNGNDSVQSIFYKVGFNSKSAFYKAFKRKFNCTPQAYRVNFYKKK